MILKPSLFFTFFIAFYSCFAQTSGSGIIYGQNAGNYHKWTNGCYYDLQYHKINGQVKWSIPYGTRPADHFNYRAVEDYRYESRVDAASVSAFVMGRDSFVVSHSKEFERPSLLIVCIDKPVKLYVSIRAYATPPSGFGPNFTGGGYDIVYTYYYGDSPYNITRIDKYNFVTALTPFIADHDDLVTKIKDGEFKVKDIPELFSIINTRIDFLNKRRAQGATKHP